MSTTIKTAFAIAALIISTDIAAAAGIEHSTAASQRSLFDQIRDTAPRSIFDQIQDAAPRSLFDQIRDTAPWTVMPFQGFADSAP